MTSPTDPKWQIFGEAPAPLIDGYLTHIYIYTYFFKSQTQTDCSQFWQLVGGGRLEGRVALARTLGQVHLRRLGGRGRRGRRRRRLGVKSWFAHQKCWI